MMTTTDYGIALECRVTRDAAALRFAYSLRNDSGGELGILNRIQSTNLDGTRSFSANNAYVDMEGTTLHVRKMALPLPEGLQMTIRPVPRASRLPAGETFREEFVLPLPVPVCNPFRRAKLASAPNVEVVTGKPAFAGTIVLSIGVFPVGHGDHGATFAPVSAAFPGVFDVYPPGYALGHQIVVDSRIKLESGLPVLDYQVVPLKT